MLSAVAGFVSILQGRLTAVVDRIRQLNDIGDEDRSRARLKSDLPRLHRWARIMNNATHFALASGVCTCLLLVVAFASAFIGLQHAYGAGTLFFLAVAMLGTALIRFGHDVEIGFSAADHYR